MCGEKIVPLGRVKSPCASTVPKEAQECGILALKLRRGVIAGRTERGALARSVELEGRKSVEPEGRKNVFSPSIFEWKEVGVSTAGPEQGEMNWSRYPGAVRNLRMEMLNQKGLRPLRISQGGRLKVPTSGRDVFIR